jgi:hypothetical protein
MSSSTYFMMKKTNSFLYFTFKDIILRVNPNYRLNPECPGPGARARRSRNKIFIRSRIKMMQLRNTGLPYFKAMDNRCQEMSSFINVQQFPEGRGRMWRASFALFCQRAFFTKKFLCKEQV